MRKLTEDTGIGPREFISRLWRGLTDGQKRDSGMSSTEFWVRREAARGGDYVR